MKQLIAKKNLMLITSFIMAMYIPSLIPELKIDDREPEQIYYLNAIEGIGLYMLGLPMIIISIAMRIYVLLKTSCFKLKYFIDHVLLLTWSITLILVLQENEVGKHGFLSLLYRLKELFVVAVKIIPFISFLTSIILLIIILVNIIRSRKTIIN